MPSQNADKVSPHTTMLSMSHHRHMPSQNARKVNPHTTMLSMSPNPHCKPAACFKSCAVLKSTTHPESRKPTVLDLHQQLSKPPVTSNRLIATRRKALATARSLPKYRIMAARLRTGTRFLTAAEMLRRGCEGDTDCTGGGEEDADRAGGCEEDADCTGGCEEDADCAGGCEEDADCTEGPTWTRGIILSTVSSTPSEWKAALLACAARASARGCFCFSFWYLNIALCEKSDDIASKNQATVALVP